MRFPTVALAIMAIVMLGLSPVVAQDQAPVTPVLTEQGSGDVSTFNRHLVNKIERSCIYIWAMTPGNSGFMQPAWIGSGVIFMALPEEDAAYALTNHHVANDTSLLQVETWDRATYKAQMVATEPGIDTALIRIEGISRDKYEPCVLGNSDNVIIGEPALAVGAPGSGDAVNTNRSDPFISFGLHQSTTLRVISGRSTNPYLFIQTWAGWKGDLGRQVMTNCPWRFVIESPISGGNSGGPLFNSHGECIGLNHAHFGGGAGLSQHENYTIPINFSKNFAFQILDTGKYELPWFGMDVLVPDYFDDYYGVSEFVERYLDENVLTIFSVRPDSPATRAIQVDEPNAEPGLQSGDIILEFDGRTFANTTELRLYTFTLPIGKTVPITVKRDRRELDFTMVCEPKRKYDSEFSL
ncbi:trypsin-like peptidase domain-containing protein [bacterium]|nr:trypsin-like peptidase domain-containing protein [bacterium]